MQTCIYIYIPYLSEIDRKKLLLDIHTHLESGREGEGGLREEERERENQKNRDREPKTHAQNGKQKTVSKLLVLTVRCVGCPDLQLSHVGQEVHKLHRSHARRPLILRVLTQFEPECLLHCARHLPPQTHTVIFTKLSTLCIIAQCCGDFNNSL